MTIRNYCHLLTDPVQKRACLSHYFPMAIFLCVCFLVGSPYVVNYKKIRSEYGIGRLMLNRNSSFCEKHGKPSGSEALPQGIISKTSNLEMQTMEYSLSSSSGMGKVESSKSLLAIAVGVKQKKVVDEIVKKFYASNFAVMLFHYDGSVDEWRDLDWSDSVLHVSAINQTKWWFAKRFLHPDIVAEYNYIFLWDEDLGVENFNPKRYISIIEKEGLEISQPALDASKSQVHYQITVRMRKGKVHRRTYKFSGGGRCYKNSTEPPCTGWVEMMAPVFSRAAWRCVWHMIQNDLIHAWGLDTKLGYCAQGDRTKNVGVVDGEYIVHKGIPSLGGDSKTTAAPNSLSDASDASSPVRSGSSAMNGRLAIRKRSYTELEMFQRRWENAAAADHCWVDPYPSHSKSKSNSSS
ncbi:uncharacterized protein LOC110038830 isoform X2 [Phalaenopsis equestris]|uniref:uncharacterized protein LOC110038830 isoform X2 n=1 Tax=Phalaenopsis equestris TaxID=78828 RepID=UPI0009E1AAE3|nr:uncharacterized protein LOC110038830 isoform X2 [Phalaenopsis equestris]